MSNQELATVDNPMNEMMGGIFSSIEASTLEEKLELYNAVSDSEELSSHLGEVIMVKDIIIQDVEIEDPSTHEVKPARRTVLVCEDGAAYGCTSIGVETSLKNLIAIVGQPTWQPALPLIAEEKRGRSGFNFTSLKYAKDAKKKK